MSTESHKIPQGATVVRGPGWEYDDQDGDAGNIGTVERLKGTGLPYSVRWHHNNSTNSYGEKDLTVIKLPDNELTLGKEYSFNGTIVYPREGIILSKIEQVVQCGWPSSSVGKSPNFSGGYDLVGNRLPSWWVNRYSTYFYSQRPISGIIYGEKAGQEEKSTTASTSVPEPSKPTLDDLDGKLSWRAEAPDSQSIGRVRLLKMVNGRWRALQPSSSPDAKNLFILGLPETLVLQERGITLRMKYFYYDHPNISSLEDASTRLATEEEINAFLSEYYRVSGSEGPDTVPETPEDVSSEERFNGKVVVLKDTASVRGLRIVYKHTTDDSWITLKPKEHKDGSFVSYIPDRYQVAGHTVLKDRLFYSYTSISDIERLATPEEEEYFYNEYLRFNPDLVPDHSPSALVEVPVPTGSGTDPYEQFNGKLVFKRSLVGSGDPDLKGLRICCKAGATWYALRPHRAPDAGSKSMLPDFFDIQGKRLLREKLYYVFGISMTGARLATPEEEQFFVQKYLEFNPEPVGSVPPVPEPSPVPDSSLPTSASTMTRQSKIDRYHMKLVRTSSWSNECDHVRLAVWVGDRFIMGRPDGKIDAHLYYPKEFLSRTVAVNGVTIRLDRMWCFGSALNQSDLDLATPEQVNTFLTEYLSCNPDAGRIIPEKDTSFSTSLNRHSVIVPSPVIPSSSDRFLRAT